MITEIARKFCFQLSFILLLSEAMGINECILDFISFLPKRGKFVGAID